RQAEHRERPRPSSGSDVWQLRGKSSRGTPKAGRRGSPGSAPKSGSESGADTRRRLSFPMIADCHRGAWRFPTMYAESSRPPSAHAHTLLLETERGEDGCLDPTARTII